MLKYWFCICLWIGITAVDSTAAEPGFRDVDRALQANNAARLDKGGRIRLEILGEEVVKDARTAPEDVVDGNVHSRQVMTGAPYRFHIDLVDELPIEEIHFICSDYAAETCPARLKIEFSEGSIREFELEKIPAVRGQAKPRQTMKAGGVRANWVEITVLRNHPPAVNAEGKTIGWGGLAEIEVITSADLDPYLQLVDFNPDLPQDIRSQPARQDYSDIEVTLPEEIPLGEHPGIYFSAHDWDALFEEMRDSQRGRPVLDGILSSADAYFGEPVVHPDPNEPAQVKDRNDPPARAHDALSKQAGILAYAWRITGDRKYADRVRRILVGYAELYPDEYKEHKGVNGSDTSKVMAQRLSEAMWLIPLIQAYDLTDDAPSFSQDDRILIERDLIRCALEFINRKTPASESVAARDKQDPDWRSSPAPRAQRSGALGNWTAFYYMAFIHGGITLEDQDWIDLGADGLKYMLENGIGEDGMWGEGAIGYQQFVRHAMVGGLEALAKKGIDLWSYKSNVFKSLFDSEFAYAYPDGTSPGINDSGRAAVGSGWTAMAFDYAYLRYGDPNYARTINTAGRQLHHSPACYFPTVIYQELPEVPVKGYSSLVFDNLGYTILRGANSGSETFLLMDYGPHGGVHGHPDKLNLILFADGDELAGEPQSYRYENELHANWTRPTIAHWTLSVDQHAQNPAEGRLICFADQGDMKVMRVQAEGAYAGVALDRAVIQMPGYIVDVHRAWGPAEHTVDYPLCFRGELDCLEGVAEESLKPMADITPGYRHIRAIGPKDIGGSWIGVWERNGGEDSGGQINRVDAMVLPEGGNTELWAGVVPGGRHQAVLRRKGGDVRFVCLVDPFVSTDAVRSAESLQVEGPVPATGIRVQRADGGTDLVVVRYDPMTDGIIAAPSSFEGLETRALVSVVRLDAAGKAFDRMDLGDTASELAQSPTYGVAELSFRGPSQRSTDSPSRDIDFEVCFMHESSGREHVVQGFYDGDGNGGVEGDAFKVRFTPTLDGRWYLKRVSSNLEELQGQNEGDYVTAIPVDHPGFWLADNDAPGRRWFQRSDGSHPYIIGNTHYSFLSGYQSGDHPSGNDIAEDVIHNARYFKKLRFSLHGDRYPDPNLKPFLDDSGLPTDSGDFSHRPNPAWFHQRVDLAVATAYDHDLIADLILAGPDTEASRSTLRAAKNGGDPGPFLRYIAARYGSFPNVWICLCNEYEIKSPHYSSAEIADFGKLIRQYLPYSTPLSVHSTPRTLWSADFDSLGAWADHMIIQNKLRNLASAADVVQEARRVPGGQERMMPLINDELSYEGAGDGHSDQDTIESHLGVFLGGGYGTTGEKPGSKLGQYFRGRFDPSEHTAADNLQWFREQVDAGIHFWKMKPDLGIFSNLDPGFRGLAWPGREYVLGTDCERQGIRAALPLGGWRVTRYDLVRKEASVIAVDASGDFDFNAPDSRAVFFHFEMTDQI